MADWSSAAPCGRSSTGVLPMAEAAEAHRVVEAGEHVGKVLLTGLSPGADSAQLGAARPAGGRTSCAVL